MPHIGIFWYDEKNRKLAGVFSANEDDIAPSFDGRRVFPILHKDIYPKLHLNCFDKFGNIKPEHKDSLFLESDYTMIPRGRVFSDDFGYQVFTGHWIDDDFDFIKNLILEEFFLLEDETEFIYDYHWDIGKGWGE